MSEDVRFALRLVINNNRIGSAWTVWDHDEDHRATAGTFDLDTAEALCRFANLIVGRPLRTFRAYPLRRHDRWYSSADADPLTDPLGGLTHLERHQLATRRQFGARGR